jgi:hypothetical protein
VRSPARAAAHFNDEIIDQRVPSRGHSSESSDRAGGGGVTRNWILYNRTASGDDASFHAGKHFGNQEYYHRRQAFRFSSSFLNAFRSSGVLLALGLQGHLNVLSITDVCDYLTQVNKLSANVLDNASVTS